VNKWVLQAFTKFKLWPPTFLFSKQYCKYLKKKQVFVAFRNVGITLDMIYWQCPFQDCSFSVQEFFRGERERTIHVYFSLHIHHLSNSRNGRLKLSSEGKTKLQPPDQKASAFASPSDNLPNWQNSYNFGVPHQALNWVGFVQLHNFIHCYKCKLISFIHCCLYVWVK
jgi:hypothetical protein